MSWNFWHDNLSDGISGTNIDLNKKMKTNRPYRPESKYLENLHTQPDDVYENKTKEKEKTVLKYKQSRVLLVYEDFKKLSQIEKENFVNMIRNFVVHGHL